MRTSKELILASKEFTKENRLRSWLEMSITLILMCGFLIGTFIDFPMAIRLLFSFMTALLYVRMFVIYHDYQHHAILQKSKVATLIMKSFGVFMLTPQTIWKRSHDHHHNHNSKLTMNGIGSYPTISKSLYFSLSNADRRIYLMNRHPLTVLFGYITLFIYWLNLKSIIESPKRHLDSLLALIIHIAASITIGYFLGTTTYFVSWFIPYFIAFGMGSYLFYSQHNFPGAEFRENQDWKYEYAALSSTSFMAMNPLMQLLTGNIGYHHVHHLNSRIPFYRLPEAMAKMPELQNPTKTSWNPINMWKCFQLKLWDAENEKMIPICRKVKSDSKLAVK